MNIEFIYASSDLRNMMKEKSSHNCRAKKFNGILLRGHERHLIASYFWRERPNCDKNKLERFASRFY